MKKFFTRQRLIVVGFVAAFIGVIAGIGAVSNSSSTSTVVAVSSGPGAPTSTWYWTMLVSPSDPNTLVLATGGGLYRSTDGGKTWAATGPKSFNATSIAQLGSTMVAGGVTLAAGSPIIRKGIGRAASDGPSVMVSSSDDGKTWKTLHPSGLPNTSVQAFATGAEGTNVLYVLLNTGALYRSADGAASFQLVSKKFGIAPWAISNPQGSSFLSGDMDSGPYTSANGKTFQKTPYKDSSGGRMVMEYAVQPTNASQVLMTSNGIALSTDGGKSWKQALKTTVMFGPVAYAPTKPTLAYAVGFDQSVWRSVDGGKTWSKIA